MSNPAPPLERSRGTAGTPKRQVTLPGAAKAQKTGVRGGLLLLGLVLVIGAGGGFWFILQSVDQRQEYIMAARTIERWEIATPADFVIVEANVGDADALLVRHVGAVVGRWATGRIPARTLVTADMFDAPPLSNDDQRRLAHIQINLPAGEAPGGTLNRGDRIALFGAEPSEIEGVEPEVRLIGVVTIRDVDGDTLTYIVTPDEAKALQDTVARYQESSQRRMWKLGFDLPTDELIRLFGAVDPADGAPELGSVRQPEPADSGG